MSSQTLIIQELYEVEKIRGLVRARKNARLEAELERLEVSEALSELRDQAKDEQLRAKDATIQALQTAIDCTDRPCTSDDVKMIEELEAKNKLLQGQVKDAEERTLLAIHGKFKEFKPFLDQTVKTDMAVALARLRDREKEIQSLKAEMMEVQVLNDALLMCMRAEERACLAFAVKHLEELILSRSEDLGSVCSPPSQQVKDKAESLSKLMELCDLTRSRFGTSLPPKPAKISRPPAEIKMLRLKNRQTLHSLDR